MTSTMGNPYQRSMQSGFNPGHNNDYSFTFNMYPLNHSLEEELNRLFADFAVSHSVSPAKPQNNGIWDDFRHNGRDYEYCPDPVDPFDKMNTVRPAKKKSKKPLPTECVFCKNNGEEARIYKKHLLKDLEGRISCPILRAYTCPTCGATKDKAHTLKYCPENKELQQLLVPMNSIKMMRNSTGRRRSK